MDMRALYYIALPTFAPGEEDAEAAAGIKANENCMNQNFTIITQKLAELEARLSAIEASI